jgi:hypothetical protein
MDYKLGKQAPRRDPRTLKFAEYLGADVPAPLTCDWSQHVGKPWGMMANDNVGDCTCAAAGHMIETWTANCGSGVVPADADVLSAYEAVSGYNPSDPGTDQGAVELDVLSFWRKTGIGGHSIVAYTSVRPSVQQHVRAACYLFGGLYIGLQLPLSANGQVGGLWDVPSQGLNGDGQPGSWGGHAVSIVAVDDDGLTCVTWGALQRMTWAFWSAYTDEAYGVLSQDWVNLSVSWTTETLSPSWFDLNALQADLAIVGS